MKIAILGTRGIPNNYGGFEQFAEYISVGLTEQGHDVYVYSSHNHLFKEKKWNSVNIIHCFDPEYKIGTAGQFIYDFNCILDSRKRKFDIILQLGYTSSSVFSFLFPKKSIIITNMDGLEWKRTKYSKAIQSFLKYAEKLAVHKSDFLISDSLGIKRYIFDTYKINSEFIPYGANVFINPEIETLKSYKLEAYNYDMLMARLEPENSIEIILDGVALSTLKRVFIVLGNYNTDYGNYLIKKFKSYPQILFLGAIYDMNIVNNLRYFSNIYFHGHTVGGTNPSLLEAMASNALIAANDNEFNSSILEKDAYYFSSSKEVEYIISNVVKNEKELMKINSNKSKIEKEYSWKKIISSYESYFEKCI